MLFVFKVYWPLLFYIMDNCNNNIMFLMTLDHTLTAWEIILNQIPAVKACFISVEPLQSQITNNINNGIWQNKIQEVLEEKDPQSILPFWISQ